MSVRDRVEDLREKYGWKELFLGFLISLLLTPVLAPVITKFYLTIGLLPSPDLTAEVQKVDTSYREGVEVERFDNITWESGYEVYRVRFNHDDGPTLSQAVVEVRFPGCIENVQVPGDNRGYGTITISTPLEPQIEAPRRPESEIVGCTAQITTEDIHTHEGYTAEFVVDHTHSRCDLLSAYNPNREFFVEYEWSENGQELDRRYVGEIQNAEDEFDRIKLPPNSTKLVQKEDYSAFIYGAGNGDTDEALSTCYGS